MKPRSIPSHHLIYTMLSRHLYHTIRTTDTSQNIMAAHVENLLGRVTNVLADERHKDIFALGGRIDTSHSQTLRSVTLRWDPKGTSSDGTPASRKVSLPVRRDGPD